MLTLCFYQIGNSTLDSTVFMGQSIYIYKAMIMDAPYGGSTGRRSFMYICKDYPGPSLSSLL